MIEKDGYEAVVARGLPAFAQRIGALVPFLADRMSTIDSWDDVKILTVRVNRLDRWHAPGVLLIGDAAHAMSPIGGVGINLAVQDAVATARLLLPTLRRGTPSTADLARVRRRRNRPTVVTQFIQRVVQKQFVGQLLAANQPVQAPGGLRLLRRLPALQGLPARMVGFGLRPEAPPPPSRP